MYLRKRKLSRKEIVLRNVSTSLSSVARSSGSLKGVIDKAKSKTPFSVAHVPGQQLRERRNVLVVGSRVIPKGKGRFSNGS